MVPELIPVLGSQPAGDVSHKPGGRLPLLSIRPAVTPATLKRAATNFAAWWTEARWVWTVCLRLLPTTSRLQFEPGPFCAWVQHANHSATEPPRADYQIINVAQDLDRSSYFPPFATLQKPIFHIFTKKHPPFISFAAYGPPAVYFESTFTFPLFTQKLKSSVYMYTVQLGGCNKPRTTAYPVSSRRRKKLQADDTDELILETNLHVVVLEKKSSC